MRAIRVPVPLFQEVATRRKDSARVHHPLTIRVHIFALGFAHSHWAAQPEVSRVSHLSPHFNSSTILVRSLQRTWPTSSPRSGVRSGSPVDEEWLYTGQSQLGGWRPAIESSILFSFETVFTREGEGRSSDRNLAATVSGRPS